MTPNEITTLVATEKQKELDVPFKKIIYERVKYWRSTLIKQTLDRVRQDARHFQQTIYLPMERANQLGLVAPVPLTEYQAMTSYKVPLPLRITDNGLFNYIGAIDGKSPFGYSDIGTLAFLQSGRYSGRDVYYQYQNNRIYLTSPDIPMIMISGVFNEPEEAMKLTTGVFVPQVDWWNLDIPMSGDIEQRVVQCILAVDFGTRNPIKPEDYQVHLNGEEQ